METVFQIDFGNPYRTNKLPNLTVITQEIKPKKETPPWIKSIIDRVQTVVSIIKENIGSLEEGEAEILRKSYTFTVNVFLRHIPLDDRQELTNKLVAMSTKVARFNPIGKDAEAETTFLLSRAFDFIVYRKPRNIKVAVHEAIHILQRLKLMPLNNAITAAATKMFELQMNPDGLVEKGKKYGDIIERFGTREIWFNLVKTGRVEDALKLGLRISEHPDLTTYFKNEGYFNWMFNNFGERVRNVGGIRNPYDAMTNVGQNRGIRAFALGYFSGNMDHGWTLLWLHSLGYDFDKCEKWMVEQIEAGKTDILYQYKELG